VRVLFPTIDQSALGRVCCGRKENAVFCARSQNILIAAAREDKLRQFFFKGRGAD